VANQRKEKETGGKNMKNLLRNRAALSTVVTTLIILVVSVLLASVVTFYAINVTTTRTSEESVQMYKMHTWQNGTSFAEVAFLLVNTGGRDIVVDKITVRGQVCAITDMFYNKTTDTISADLSYQEPSQDGTAIADLNVTVGGKAYTFVQGEDGSNLILPAGKSLMVYIVNPDHVSVNDIGVTLGITLFTADAQYYKECNVEASS
jgi:hypothetical protein